MIAPPDPAWPRAADGHHAPLWRASILTRTGAVAAADLPFTDGAVDKDEDRRCTANINVPTSAVPALADQAYLPMGGRVRIDYSIGGRLWMTVADLDIVASAIARPENMWTLALADQTYRVAMDDLARGGVVLGTTTYAAAIGNLIRRTFPQAAVDIAGPATTIPIDRAADWADDGDPWQLLQQLAAAASSVLWQDPATRVFKVREAPAAPAETGAPVDVLSVGDGGQLTGYTIDHELGYNQHLLIHESDADPPSRVVGSWLDTRPDSPVAVQRIGSRVVRAERTTGIEAGKMPTKAQADAAAARLAHRTGEIGRAHV